MLTPREAPAPAAAACPACAAPACVPLLQRRGVPVHQNLLCATREAARGVSRGDLALAACRDCGLVFNAAFDPGRLTYAGAYDSDQSHSPAFLRHVDERIQALLDDGLRGAEVVEAGCGSGYFLRRLCARGACHGLGFDPGYRGPEHDPSGARFVRAVFEGVPSVPAGARADAVVSRHVIEHVADPAGFARALTRGLPPGTRFYFETPSLEWIVARTALWDLFYEHCNYFSAGALARTLQLAGLRATSVTQVFGGQYLWARASLEAGASTGALTALEPIEPLLAFARRCDDVQARLRAQVERLAAAGALALWGAAAKGATFASLVDPEGVHLRCLVDVNPARQGRFLAGTGHAIVAPEELRARGVGNAIVMNPNYLDEVRAQVERLGARVRLHLPGEP